MMKSFFVIFFVSLLVGACATRPTPDLDFDEPETSSSAATGKVKKTTKSETSTTLATHKAPGIVVDAQDLKTLEQMNKAIEAYVLKNEKKSFTTLCKDKRFDCFIEEKVFPKGKKKITRSVPPYASGSKMGLQGEQRVHARYEFFP